MGRACCTVDGLNAEDLGRPVRADERAELAGLEDDMAEVRTTHQAIAALNLDVKASSVPQDFKDHWATFVTEWLQWVEMAKAVKLRFSTTSLRNKAIEYRKRTIAYFDAFKAAGGKPTVAPPPPPAPEKSLPERVIDTVLKGALVVALIGGGAYVVGNVIKR